MYIAFQHPCIVGAILPDGTRTSMLFDAGRKLRTSTSCLCYKATFIDHHELELEDGTVLVNVPTVAIEFERDDV